MVDVDEHRKYCHERLQKFEKIMRKEAHPEEGWDSDDDMMEYDFKEGQQIDYCDKQS